MDIFQLAPIAAMVVGATWVLRSKLGNVESAIGRLAEKLEAHVEKDTAEHKAVNARVIKLEGRSPRARR